MTTLPLLMTLMTLACGDKDGGADSGMPGDGGAMDGGSGDGGSGDGGSGDGGSGDGGSGDGGSGDGGSGDGGSGDGGSGDGGSGDGGSGDGGSGDGGSGDGGSGDGGSAAPLELIGSYLDSESNEHVITKTQWLIDFGPGDEYSYAISAYDNDLDWLVAENGDNDHIERGKWSRFDWTVAGDGQLYVCQTTNTATDEAAALAATPANGADLTSGCPGWGWLALSGG